MAFTYFFRDLQTLEVIRDHVLPSLRGRRFIKIWDAGCAMGPEPYSLAMVLREGMGHMQFRNVKIMATDIDHSNLFKKIIESGVYPEDQVKRIPKDIFERFFSPAEEEKHWKLIDEIRSSVEYQRHNLLTLSPPVENVGLIICKNVLLHFQPAERVEVIKMFHDALDTGGFLAVEQTQTIPDELSGKFEPVVENARVFRKVA